jgi:hypothetical protein
LPEAWGFLFFCFSIFEKSDLLRFNIYEANLSFLRVQFDEI